MNRWFNALLALFAFFYFGGALAALAFPSSFPIGAAGSYDAALGQVFAANGDIYSSVYSEVYQATYYASVALLIVGLILLALRKPAGMWFFITFICLETFNFYLVSSNTVVTFHKVLTISGLITYPAQGAIIALYFASMEKLGFKRILVELDF